jgi:hypothetical protein
MVKNEKEYGDEESQENVDSEDDEECEDNENNYVDDEEDDDDDDDEDYDEEGEVVDDEGFPLSIHSGRDVHPSWYELVREPTDEAGQFLRYQYINGVERTVFQGPRGGRFYRGPSGIKVYLPGWMYSRKNF